MGVFVVVVLPAVLVINHIVRAHMMPGREAKCYAPKKGYGHGWSCFEYYWIRCLREEVYFGCLVERQTDDVCRRCEALSTVEIGVDARPE